jgi:hypothetical protein
MHVVVISTFVVQALKKELFLKLPEETHHTIYLNFSPFPSPIPAI